MIEKVLVIDDTHINRVVAEKQLAKLNISCDVSRSGADALTLAADTSYRAILVDISMPEMDGLEFTRRFRQGESPQYSRTPIIGMTGRVGKKDKAEMLDAGMDDVLEKPLDLDTLAAVLERESGADIVDIDSNALAHGASNVPAHGKNEDQSPVDLARLSEILGTDDNREMFAMLSLLTNEFASLLAPVEEAHAARDVRALHDAVHKARSAASSVAALDLAVLLNEIELDANSGDWEGLGTKITQVGDEYTRVQDFCREWDDQG